MAKVEGNSNEKAFQNIGIFDSGHAIPETKSSIMLNAGNITSAASRLRKKAPIVMEKNVVASINGTIRVISEPIPPMCGSPNSRGIIISPYIERAVYMMK